MAGRTTVLITGANRGIGKGLLTTYLARANHTVVAGVRDPNNLSSEQLHNLPHGDGSNLIILKIDSASETDALSAVKILTCDHDINKLDVVIANAGISNYFGKAIITPVDQMFEHFKVNSVGPLLLFQATSPLLNVAPNPKFVTISSGAGSISGQDKLPVENTAYGTSKAAANFITRKIHFENPTLVAFPINPGWLQTDLGTHAAIGAGMVAAPVSVEDGVAGVIDKIDNATRDNTSGKFMTSNGGTLGW